MKRLPVTYKGKVECYTMVDNDIAEWLNGKSITLYNHRGCNRAMVVINKKQGELPWWIMQPPKGKVTDHIDRDPMNNQKANLRIVDKAQNAWNSTKKSEGASSRYKGVSYFKQDKRKKRWRACINVRGKQHHLGYFMTEKEAAIAFNEAAKKYYGEYGVLNEVCRLRERDAGSER